MTLHTKISYIKSVLRIIGYIILIAYNDTLLTIAAITLIAAEVLGIAEEAWPGAYKGTTTEEDEVKRRDDAEELKASNASF
jgi:hypothetical protein